MTTASFTRTAWQETLNTTREMYAKQVTELIMRKRILLAWIRKYGNIKKAAGDHLAWVYEYKQSTPVQYADGNPIAFAPIERHGQAAIDWRSYIAPDAISNQQVLMNQGDAALVKLGANRLEKLMNDMKTFFNQEMYNDGYAAGNENALHGFETLFGTGTTVAADIVAQPSDTYATVSTALGNSALWSATLTTKPNANAATDWPYGGLTTAPEYDYWSPVIANISSTSWGTGSTTWESNCLAVLRFLAEVQPARCADAKSRPDLFLTNSKMNIELKNRLEQRFRSLTPHKEATDLGFPGTVEYEGLAVSTDWACPQGTAYMINASELQLHSFYDGLFKSEGPEWYMDRQAYLMLVHFFGNLRFTSPKYQACAKSVA